MSEQNFYPLVTLRGRDFGIIEEVAKINEHDEKVRLKTVNGDLYFCYDVKNPRNGPRGHPEPSGKSPRH